MINQSVQEYPGQQRNSPLKNRQKFDKMIKIKKILLYFFYTYICSYMQLDVTKIWSLQSLLIKKILQLAGIFWPSKIVIKMIYRHRRLIWTFPWWWTGTHLHGKSPSPRSPGLNSPAVRKRKLKQYKNFRILAGVLKGYMSYLNECIEMGSNCTVTYETSIKLQLWRGNKIFIKKSQTYLKFWRESVARDMTSYFSL